MAIFCYRKTKSCTKTLCRNHAGPRRSLVEFASGEKVIRSEVVRGFWMERAWLDPDHLPRIADALARVS
jgi:hypothetical protein